jgi:hypothetical protein
MVNSAGSSIVGGNVGEETRLSRRDVVACDCERRFEATYEFTPTVDDRDIRASFITAHLDSAASPAGGFGTSPPHAQ